MNEEQLNLIKKRRNKLFERFSPALWKILAADVADKDVLLLIEEVEKLQRFKKYFDGLYGQGLEIANWHLNGDLEPFDNFYEESLFYMEKESCDSEN